MAPLPAPEPYSCWTQLTRSKLASSLERNRIKLPMGVETIFGMIRTQAYLAVPITDDGQVVLLRQYRFAVQALFWSSLLALEEEDPLESMQRELGEEAGYSAAEWDVGPDFPAPAIPTR